MSPISRVPAARRRPLRRAAAVLAGAALCAAAGVPAQAQPSLPWTPSPAARHALHRLVDDAGLPLPVTQWPLPRAAVAHALDALPAALAPPLAAARDRVAAELERAAGGSASFAWRGRAQALAGFGDAAAPGPSLALRTPTLEAPGLALQAGVRAGREAQAGGDVDELRLDDAALVAQALGVHVQAFAHRSWWGPGWQGSLLLGHNAPAFAGVGVQRASAAPSASPWLAWLGPWTGEFFVARADDPAHTRLVGLRLALRPLRGVELGVSRASQWGGRGRPQSVRSFLRMLVGRGQNAGATAPGVDPANSMAGFDARVRCPRRAPCAGYAQFIGEDEADGLPSHYLGLYGVEAWSADGRHRGFAEFAETICGAPFGRRRLRGGCAYRNHAYPDGYTHGTRWIGAAAGPDSRLLTLGWLDAARGTSLRLHHGRVGARVGVFGPDRDPAHSGRLLGAAARQAWTWGPWTLGAELDWLRVAAPAGARREARLGLAVSRPLP